MAITREQLIDLWYECGGHEWLTTGPGNAYCPSLDAYPELHTAAEPYSLVYFIHCFNLGNEKWAAVLACGHVIVPPYLINRATS